MTPGTVTEICSAPVLLGVSPAAPLLPPAAALHIPPVLPPLMVPALVVSPLTAAAPLARAVALAAAAPPLARPPPLPAVRPPAALPAAVPAGSRARQLGEGAANTGGVRRSGRGWPKQYLTPAPQVHCSRRRRCPLTSHRESHFSHLPQQTPLQPTPPALPGRAAIAGRWQARPARTSCRARASAPACCAPATGSCCGCCAAGRPCPCQRAQPQPRPLPRPWPAAWRARGPLPALRSSACHRPPAAPLPRRWGGGRGAVGCCVSLQCGWECRAAAVASRAPPDAEAQCCE